MKRPAAASLVVDTPDKKHRKPAAAAGPASTPSPKEKAAGSEKKTPPKTKKPDPVDETKRLMKNAHSKAYHEACSRAKTEGHNDDDAKAAGRAAGLEAKNLFLASRA